ncbi:hypothetical protein KAH94_04360 [bacterium]|nr:hypothetical protein [bacterium]
MIKKIVLLAFFFSYTALSSRKIIYVVNPGCGKKAFESPDCERDGVAIPYFNLKQAFLKLGYQMRIVKSPENLQDAEMILCFNVKNLVDQYRASSKEKLVLFAFEPEAVLPENYQKKYHDYFSKVYTYCDDFIDNVKYFKFYYPRGLFDVTLSDCSFEEKKLSAMINCKKNYPHRLSLYGERRRVIEFFENKYHGDFDLYGFGWSKKDSKNYKGTVASKVATLKDYKFSFVYENMRDFSGWVSEKPFDAMISGCVPVYWGPDNITKYIPKECFIDRRDFASTEDVYWFLKNMTQAEHQKYVDAIKVFLSSARSRLFSSEMFVDIVLSCIDPYYDKMVVFTKEQIELLEVLKTY